MISQTISLEHVLWRPGDLNVEVYVQGHAYEDENVMQMYQALDAVLTSGIQWDLLFDTGTVDGTYAVYGLAMRVCITDVSGLGATLKAYTKAKAVSIILQSVIDRLTEDGMLSLRDEVVTMKIRYDLVIDGYDTLERNVVKALHDITGITGRIYRTEPEQENKKEYSVLQLSDSVDPVMAIVNINATIRDAIAEMTLNVGAVQIYKFRVGDSKWFCELRHAANEMIVPDADCKEFIRLMVLSSLLEIFAKPDGCKVKECLGYKQQDLVDELKTLRRRSVLCTLGKYHKDVMGSMKELWATTYENGEPEVLTSSIRLYDESRDDAGADARATVYVHDTDMKLDRDKLIRDTSDLYKRLGEVCVNLNMRDSVELIFTASTAIKIETNFELRRMIDRLNAAVDVCETILGRLGMSALIK